MKTPIYCANCEKFLLYKEDCFIDSKYEIICRNCIIAYQTIPTKKQLFIIDVSCGENAGFFYGSFDGKFWNSFYRMIR